MEKIITFVAKLSKSNSRKLINIPANKLKELDEEAEYYEVHLIPIKFTTFKKLTEKEN